MENARFYSVSLDTGTTGAPKEVCVMYRYGVYIGSQVLGTSCSTYRVCDMVKQVQSTKDRDARFMLARHGNLL